MSTPERGRVDRAVLGRRRELVDQPPGDARRDERVAARGVPDRAQQIDGLGVLQEEPGGAGADRLEHVLVEVERGEHHDVHGRRATGSATIVRVAARPSTLGIRMSITTTSGSSCAGELDRGRAVVGLADDLDVVLGVEQHPQTGPEQRLVVGEHDTDPQKMSWR